MFSLSGVDGSLSSGDRGTPVVFDVFVGRDGRVRVLFRSIPLTSDVSWLHRAAFPGDLVLPRLRLAGAGPAGATLSSDRVYITRVATTSLDGGPVLDLEAQAEPLHIVYPEPSPPHNRRVACYRTIGMRGFSVVSCEAPEGTVALAAPHEPQEYGALEGIITIESADTSPPLASWLATCDDLIARILDIVSLGQGRYVRYGIRECYVNETLAQLDFYGAHESTDPYQPCFHHLNMEPVLTLAVNSYTPRLRDDAGLGIAIEWLLMNPRYIEGKYLTAHTAIEHLLAILGSHLPTTILEPEAYQRAVLPRLASALELASKDLPDASDEDLAFLRRKLDGLNHRPFTDRLLSLFEHLRVPTSDLADRIPAALRARNKLLHRGRYTGDEPLQEHLTVLRELVVRTILTLLNFHGYYESYLRDPTWGPFPPVTKQPSVAT